MSIIFSGIIRWIGWNWARPILTVTCSWYNSSVTKKKYTIYFFVLRIKYYKGITFQLTSNNNMHFSLRRRRRRRRTRFSAKLPLRPLLSLSTLSCLLLV